MTSRAQQVPATVTWGLLAAWLIHDTEELLTMPGWVDRARPRLRRRLPWVPDRVWDGMRVTPAQTAIAIGAMGVLVAAASARGARSGGRSPFYQAALVGFGVHGAGHVAQSVLTGGYTPGVVTAPVVAGPFALWAAGRLRKAGVPVQLERPGRGLLLMAAAILGSQGVGRALTMMRDRVGER
ncbi:HXXEE domain-containing protein [Actinoplanes sp. CA-030573]|uniref:HXXEE domain-containing protein n=1 Tax=Actinoplanes sp. CA-030573 TaxID=3239898 RepID=UPI003D8CD08F